ncbi:hypothetical protein NE237_010511 [Protea cynaroides]|uniref:Uncharacterized protein n=1 Tax=Protea cynaroides TaxID=273540 RepID=A0A9Q0L0S0_9MAGN|nr:hypothetical protein NE237_010511 [Protea cynaroides]
MKREKLRKEKEEKEEKECGGAASHAAVKIPRQQKANNKPRHKCHMHAAASHGKRCRMAQGQQQRKHMASNAAWPCVFLLVLVLFLGVLTPSAGYHYKTATFIRVRMKLVALLWVLMLVSPCLGARRKALVDETFVLVQERLLEEEMGGTADTDSSTSGYSSNKDANNDHHGMTRHDFNERIAGGGNGTG